MEGTRCGDLEDDNKFGEKELVEVVVDTISDRQLDSIVKEKLYTLLTFILY